MDFTIRVRMGNGDAHYGGSLVAGAKVLGLFGDAATGLLITTDGDEGLFVAYQEVRFLAPVYAGDFLEVRAAVTKTGRTSRTMKFEAWKIIAAQPELGSSAADLLPQPILVAEALGTCVVPANRQRKGLENGKTDNHSSPDRG